MNAQPYNQPQTQPVSVSPEYRTAGVPQQTYFKLLIAGIVIFLIGGIIYISAGFLNDPEEYDEREDYSDTVRTITTLGNLFQYIGLILLCIGLIIGALKDTNLPQNVRLGMLIAMGLIVGFKIASVYSLVISY